MTRGFWRRHWRKAFLSMGILGSGYTLYKLYSSHQQRLLDLEQRLIDLEEEKLKTKAELRLDLEQRLLESEEEKLKIKSQLQACFENIQRLADLTTLPCAIQLLHTRIFEVFELSNTDPNLLNHGEKMELWETGKILGFVTVVFWAMTLLSLYIRLQVNILARHLLDEDDQFEEHGEQDFLATANYLSSYGLTQLIPSMEMAATEVLKGKLMEDIVTAPVLRETIKQIMERFMSIGGPHHWVTYLVPVKATSSSGLEAATTSLHPDIDKLDQLIVEASSVLSSEEFGGIVNRLLKFVVDAAIEKMELHSDSSSLLLGNIWRTVSRIDTLFLEEPISSKISQVVQILSAIGVEYKSEVEVDIQVKNVIPERAYEDTELMSKLMKMQY